MAGLLRENKMFSMFFGQSSSGKSPLPRATAINCLIGIVRYLDCEHNNNQKVSRIPGIWNFVSEFKDLSMSSGTLLSYDRRLWIAPERFTSKPTPESDVYSLGVISWQLATHNSPLEGLDELEAFKIIKEGYNFDWPEGCCPILKEVGQSCIQKDPSVRPKIPEILDYLELLRASSF